MFGYVFLGYTIRSSGSISTRASTTIEQLLEDDPGLAEELNRMMADRKRGEKKKKRRKSSFSSNASDVGK